MGDLLYYLGREGRLPTLEGLDDFAHQGDRLHRESWQALQRKGIDPFRVALEHARDMEMEFHASYRPAGFKFPPDHDHFDYGDAFYDRHPELRGRDRDGNATPRISYAYPETRKYAVSLLREVAANYDVDGVSLLYNRRPPFSEYEAPMVEGFIAEHGKDPRQLDDEDPSWLMYRCGVLTQFMREVREAMDDEARRQGRRRIVVSAIVMRDAAENLYYGMDLKTLGLRRFGRYADTLHVGRLPGQLGALVGRPARRRLLRGSHEGDVDRAGDEPAAPVYERRDVPRTGRRAVRRGRGEVLLLGLHARQGQLRRLLERAPPPRPQG